MSLPVFKPAQITPINTQTIPTTKTLSSKPLLPMHRPPPVYGKLCNGLVVRASLPQPSPAVVDGDAMSLLERCFRASPPSDLPSLASSSSLDVMYGPVMKGQYGAFGAATLEKSKLDMSQKQQSKSSPETASGGGNNDIGNSNNLGGGDGGNDDGDDDNYFDNFDDGDEGSEGGLFRRRIVLPELFDQKFVDAVLNEWQECNKPMKWGCAFPVMYFCMRSLRLDSNVCCCIQGLVSSAQMVKFLAINARPTTARFISRTLPQGMSRAFIGRMIADPAFLYRLLLEQAATVGFSVWLELKNRKERIKQE